MSVVGLGGVTGISAGPAHACASLASGSILCWGTNTSGQLGDGTMTDSAVPVTVFGF